MNLPRANLYGVTVCALFTKKQKKAKKSDIAQTYTGQRVALFVCLMFCVFGMVLEITLYVTKTGRQVPPPIIGGFNNASFRFFFLLLFTTLTLPQASCLGEGRRVSLGRALKANSLHIRRRSSRCRRCNPTIRERCVDLYSKARRHTYTRREELRAAQGESPCNP